MWRHEYEYVAQMPARQHRHMRRAWQINAPSSASEPYTGAFDIVTRDEGHDGWTLDDFCSQGIEPTHLQNRMEELLMLVPGFDGWRSAVLEIRLPGRWPAPVRDPLGLP